MTPVAVHQLAHDLYARVTQLQALRASGITIKEEMEREIAEAVEPLVELAKTAANLGCACKECRTTLDELARWRSE